MSSRFIFYPLLLLLLLPGLWAGAQVMNSNLDPAAQQASMFNKGKDSSTFKQSDWKEEHARIYYNYLNSAVTHYPDTLLGSFHRYQPRQPWWIKDLGNYGTAARDPFFTPDIPMGLSLGYHIYDVYQFTLDSLQFFNTTRPYSAFSFMLGSKNEQNVEILHTQNISPGWNIAGRLHYQSAQGFYKRQKANGIAGSFSTNYTSKNQRYYVAAGLVYNRNKQNENGGIPNVRFLDSSSFGDRQLIDVNLPGIVAGSQNSAVTNVLRKMDFYIQNNYSFGKTDTLYTKDSTGMSLQFTPRFRIKHQLQIHSERHIFKDMAPGTQRYRFIDSFGFTGIDTVVGIQNWFYVDNKFSLNGFIGKRKELVQLEAGIGNRIDRFSTQYVSGSDQQSSVGNYLFGELKKEAFTAGQWNYLAAATLFFTGDATGNFDIKASVGKDLGKWGMFSGGFRQNLSNAPYAYTSFRTNFYNRTFSFDKTSTTQLWATVGLESIQLELGVKNNLITNYIYFDSDLNTKQQSEPFSVLQIFGRKLFRLGAFTLDNEVAWQQPTGNAPVNIPALLLRHKLGIETAMFRKALYVAMGLEVKYHTPYYVDGYTPYFNQFFYQKDYKPSNAPECSAYFNFKIKSFRAFVLAEQLQQFFTTNVIQAVGDTPGAVYPAPNAMFRFGFTWILIN
ncbi:putative porin [Taibaiella koreensis]|uniref:putative porin n=1 Tax=Taibaiella koreensis TaxID=1268548 RepID=UPI000E59B6C9|nr:putative porin [Taibaiella koreensis]